MQRVTRYHYLLVALHWLLALLIIAALALAALVMARIPNTDPMKMEALSSHMIGGGLILVLMLLRVLVRTNTAHPPEAEVGNPFLRSVAWMSHRALYALVLVQAGCGVVLALQAHLPEIVFLHHGTLPADFWAFPARRIHYVVSRALMALIALHVTGALYHALVRRDGLLSRMWFGRRTVAASAPPEPPASSPSTVRS